MKNDICTKLYLISSMNETSERPQWAQTKTLKSEKVKDLEHLIKRRKCTREEMIRLPPIPDNLQDPMPMVSPFVNLSFPLGPKVSFKQTLNANHIRTVRYLQDKLKVTSATNAIWTCFIVHGQLRCFSYQK